MFVHGTWIISLSPHVQGRREKKLKTARRTFLVAFVLAAASQLPGCATNVTGWDLGPDSKPLPAVFRIVNGAEIQRHCPTVSHPTGCAVSDYASGICWVYVEAPPRPWIVSHELYHCAGFNHVR